jgi:hypothetical protein
MQRQGKRRSILISIIFYTYTEDKSKSRRIIQAAEITRKSSKRVSELFFLSSPSGEWGPNWVHSARRPLLVYFTCPG